VTVTRYGGHCGFFENLARPGWAERRVLEELCGPEAQLDDTRIVEAR